ncbi:hypothetical protein I305_03094 [Cryptococcus gattii E566]|uniref:Transporter, putative n=2 Tax=Cryptococcus gattii TaxID=37769 RepID=E6QZD0_CRYGW|nr:transporter, putative [Cryptococcus gattii WM276]ADV19523.1 transporter, putative [Cryptococcus gattii WM276]KIR80043.1 hypothetical protein I306_03007 [Cryptococcus gattii EJB2]KIY34314.1 hypothetical protein I305_03094 [Cryptococcus gattii E566]KJE05326.1 hypothetical protein I311_01005 [Cryptococcus gattii NT-10]
MTSTPSPPISSLLRHTHTEPPQSAAPQNQPSKQPQLRSVPSKTYPDYDPFPIQLNLVRSLSRAQSRPHTSLHRPPTRQDGLDNIPPPLPASSIELDRRLSRDPDVERQMGVNDDDVGPPPEGGAEAWCCVGAAFMVLFCIFGFVTSFGQLKTYYAENQLSDYSQSEIAWIGTLQSFLTFAGSIVSGRYFDSHGARTITILGTSLSVGATIGLAFCKEYYQFILAHALFGFSGTIMYSPSTAVSGHWFMRRRSTAVGIVVCGAGAGGIVYPVALKKLFEQLNFRDSILIIACMNAVLMFPAWFFLKARLPPRRPPPVREMKRPWKEARYTCLVLGSALVMMNVFSPYFNAPVLLTSNGLSENLASYSIAILQAGSMIGRALSGVLADLFGVWTVFVISILGSSISVYAFWVPQSINTATAVVGLVAYGIFSGAWIALVAASCGAISPTREFGMRLGMLWSTTSVLCLIGPVICGVLISSNNATFEYAGIFVGSTHLLGAFVTVGPRLVEVTRDFLRRLGGKSGSGYDAEHEEKDVTESVN